MGESQDLSHPVSRSAVAPTIGVGTSGLSEPDLVRVVNALRAGDAIVYPTETFYGLGARARDPVAVDRVQAVKGRPDGKPFPVLVADLAMLERTASRVPGVAQRLIERYWPGALTLILPATAGFPAGVVGADGTIACRISPATVANQIVSALGEPLVATSANRSGEASPRTAAEAARQVGDGVRWIVDGGALPGRLGSTIVDATVDPPRIVRSGDLDVDLGVGSTSDESKPLRGN